MGWMHSSAAMQLSDDSPLGLSGFPWDTARLLLIVCIMGVLAGCFYYVWVSARDTLRELRMLEKHQQQSDEGGSWTDKPTADAGRWSTIYAASAAKSGGGLRGIGLATPSQSLTAKEPAGQARPMALHQTDSDPALTGLGLLTHPHSSATARGTTATPARRLSLPQLYTSPY